MPVLRRRVGSVISVLIAGLVAAFLTVLALAPAAAAAPDRGHPHRGTASAHKAPGPSTTANKHSTPKNPGPSARPSVAKQHGRKAHGPKQHAAPKHPTRPERPSTKPHGTKPHGAKYGTKPHGAKYGVEKHVRMTTRPAEGAPYDAVRAANHGLRSADRPLPSVAKRGLGVLKAGEHGKAHVVQTAKGHRPHLAPPKAPAKGHGVTAKPTHHAVAPTIRPVAMVRTDGAAAPQATRPQATTHRPHPPAPPVTAGGGPVITPPPPLQRLVQEIKDVAGFSLFGSLVGWAMAGVVLVALAMMAAAFAIGRRRASTGKSA